MARVLVADDDPDIVDLLALELAREGHEVLRADNGRVALDVAEQHRPDLILMDICMPVMTGIEACRELKGTETLASVPVVLISARGSDEDVIAGLDVGAHDYISKPFRWPFVAARIRAALRIRRANEIIRCKNEELDQFSYFASHDLQQPLRHICAFGDLLKEDLGDDLSESAAQSLGFITAAAARARTLVKDLLTLSQAGKSAMRREPVSLDECVDQALDMLVLARDQAGAEISRETLPIAHGDATLLTQIYQNLIGNALKFRSENTAPKIELTAAKSDTGFVLGVRDNGIGIAEKDRKSVFGAFKRLHGTSEFEGSGIGLAFCQKVVRLHGGSIWVENPTEGGSHFRFGLPDVDHLPTEPSE